jgi:hypothetical protein
VPDARGARLLGLPAPDITFGEREVSAAVGRTLGSRARGAGLELTVEQIQGAAEERATGRRTVYLRRRGESAFHIGFDDLSARREATSDERFALELSPDGRATALIVTTTGRLAGALDLPDVAQPAAGLLAARGAGGHRRAIVEARLELTGPEDEALVDEVLAVLGGRLDGRAAQLAARRLRERLRSDALVSASVFAGREDRYGPTVNLAVVGGRGVKSFTQSRLVAAASRGPDGDWYAREDCGIAA